MHTYSILLYSMGFAGMVVGMLVFGTDYYYLMPRESNLSLIGYLSDKVGRKFGMV